MHDKKRQQILAKIRALYAKASDSAATPEEAEAFMEKVNELLLRYNIEEYEVNGGFVDSTDLSGEECEITVDLTHFRQMAHFVAKYYFCVLCVSSLTEVGRVTPHHMYIFIGKPHNRVVAKEMFAYLMQTCRRCALAIGAPRPERNEFMKGMSMRLSFRLFELIRAREKRPSANGRDLVVINTEVAQAQAFADAISNNTLPARRLNPNLKPAAFHGWRAGADVSLNPQVAAYAPPSLKDGDDEST